MSLKSPPPGDGDSDEISVVIRALRAADLRLEELTSGEVDTVSDRDGRSFLLQRAQNQLREGEASKQTAILNALPACIAPPEAAGMRSVLSGKQTSFSMQYPCELPTGRHWFLLTTTPLATDHPRGAVIMHVDITDQRRSEAALRRFAVAMDATSDALFLVDR